ncbi:solute carrier family 26 member 10-like isoform X2 [Cimex lectularius]|nr:solute carrier family 26 member 10-like isoform X2 [Cimex lectularius]XP_014247286.1 solute carrier family 26 member 10-like isoform X2 [Cimex lectularius]XP_014247287.1 solute carrier family 26 member 10-like isoform X2 [Cimex lectularius]
MEEHHSKIEINRKVYLQNSENFKTEKMSLKSSVTLKLQCQPKKCLINAIPAIGWLSTYNWKEWLIKDFICGFTVAVMNIPQGMAYAILGNVPPVVGIYMAFFPVIVYAILGTSRHISMGSFAVVCLMAGNVILKNSPSDIPKLQNNHTTVEPVEFYSPIEIATALTFMVAIYQLFMYVFRLGIICTLLSETLVSGFTAGAAIHVLTSQLKDIFGVSLVKVQGPLKLIYIYIDLFSKLSVMNIGAIICSALTITVLVINNEFLKPYVQKKTFIPIPIELLVVLCGTLASTYGNIATNYGLKTVGHIAVGLPEPAVPNFNLLPAVALDSITITIIGYISSFSMALIFANKLKYEIDPNQELLAQGCGNLFGSFFSCLPFAASLSRSAIQESVGGCTQLASLFSCGLLLFVLLWIGPFFEPLPRCILASLIVVALKGILFQVKDIVSIFKTSTLDGIIWLSTYVTVIIVEVEYGLLVGVCISISILFIRGIKLQITTLERIPNTEIYVEPNKYVKTEGIPGITIIHYAGCINFVNKLTFKSKVNAIVSWTPIDDGNITNTIKPLPMKQLEAIIFDFRSVQYIDASGAKAIKEILQTLNNSGKSVLFVGLQEYGVSTLNSCNVFNEPSVPIFPTVHDAVIYFQSTASKTSSITDLFTARL